MSEREHFYFWRDKRGKFFQLECAVVSNWNVVYSRADSFREELPGNEIAVMLHLSEQDHVARTEEFSAPRLRDQIDAFSRAAGEHDLIHAFGADKVGHALPGSLVMLSCACAQRVQAAMDVGVLVFVIMADDVEHSAGLLRTRRAVEINQRMTIHALPQNRELLAER